MKKRISDKELSAYFDGESGRPEEVARHIQESDETSRHFAQISRMSERLQALPEPRVRDGFTGRVLASIEASPAERQMGWGLGATMSVAAATVVLLLATIVSFNDGAEPTIPLNTAVVPAEDEAALFEELQRQLAANPESQVLLTDSFYEVPEPVEELPEALLTALAPPEWVDTFSDPVLSGSYELALNSLSDPERAILARLLEEHAQAAHEG